MYVINHTNWMEHINSVLIDDDIVFNLVNIDGVIAYT